MTAIAAARIRFALALAVSHWLLLALMQCEAILGYLPPGASRGATAVGYIMAMPFLQAEGLLVSAAVGLLAWLLAGWRATRVLAVALWTLLALHVVFDQVYYKLFFDHFRPSAIEGMGQVNPGHLLGSIRSEFDIAAYVNLAVVLVAAGWLAWRCVWRLDRDASSATAQAPRVGWLFPSAVGLLIVSGIPSIASTRYLNLQHHPLLVLAHDAIRPGLIAELRDAGRAGAEDAGPLEALPEERDPRLADVARACRAGPRPPNVLLIVIESVGSRQLLRDDGLPSDRVTPRLAAMARGGAVFDSVYSVFPGSVRTHVAMTTGGRHLTWGSIYELLGYRYRGPTLPRSFADGGYAPALFSGERLDSENMAAAMRQVGYETLYDFGEDRAHQTPEFMITSWGAREEFTISRIERWLDARRDGPGRDPRPFFLNYLTAATHHPYGVPDGYAGPFAGTDALSRYRNAMHYTDAAIGKLLDALAARGLLAGTIVAITGDHGQAFGDLHPMNFTHRNRIYEENVKSFLMIVPPSRLAGPVVSRRVGTTGDIMTTLLAAAGLDVPDVPGRNLLAESFVPGPVFFHKNVQPEQWGLRLGSWKYIAGIRDRTAELHDLSRDPDEQVNLAGQEPGRVARYDAYCRRTFIRRDDEFTARLEGYRPAGGRGLSVDDLRTPGPKTLTMGIVREVEGARRFFDRGSFRADERPYVHARWIPYERATPMEFCWRSPGGQECREVVTILPESAFAHSPFPGPLPLQPGRWTMAIRDPGTGRDLLGAAFHVGPKAADGQGVP